MGLSIDASQNYLIWGNCEQISFRSKTQGDGAQYAISTAKRRAPTYRELSASNGAYTGQDVVWLIPATVIPGNMPIPKPADRVIDALGNTWTALEVALNTLKSTWRLMTRNLNLAYQLYDLIDIQRPGITYDVAGGAVRGWPDDATASGSIPYRQIPAKVQLISQDDNESLGVLGAKAKYSVFVGQDVIVNKTDRVKWTSAGVTTYLDVLGQSNPQRIDELPVLDCETLP